MTEKSEIVNKWNELLYYANNGSNLANNIKYKGTRGHKYYVNKIVESNVAFKTKLRKPRFVLKMCSVR